MKAKIRGTEIFFDITGSQVSFKNGKYVYKPVIFLLHGGPGGNHLSFKRNADELSKFAQLVFIDHRSCGLSKKTKASECTMTNNIEDIEALRKYLGYEKIIVQGASYGGMVAQGYAIKYQKFVDKLILEATAPSHRFMIEAQEYLKLHGTKEQIKVCDKFLWNGKFRSDKDVKHYFELLDPLYSVSGKKLSNIKSREIKYLLSYEVLNQGFSTFLHHFDYTPKLHRIKSPTLILAGRQDWICNLSQAKEMVEHIPNSILKIFNRCGHSISIDATKQYLTTLKKFICER